jgi:mannose/fructose/N-acetylgalactosamine-specific phosphotransferase system component IIC
MVVFDDIAALKHSRSDGSIVSKVFEAKAGSQQLKNIACPFATAVHYIARIILTLSKILLHRSENVHELEPPSLAVPLVVQNRM